MNRDDGDDDDDDNKIMMKRMMLRDDFLNDVNADVVADEGDEFTD